MKTYEERREEKHKYEMDVMYEVYRSGGNPDAVNYDRVSDNYYEGIPAEQAAQQQIRSQQSKPLQPEELEGQEEQEQ